MKKIILILVTAAVASCTKKKAEPTVAQKYEVNFSASDDKTLASAMYTDTYSGSYITFPGATVTANGVAGTVKQLPWMEWSYCPYYAWELAGVADVTFSLSKNGKTLVNRVSRADMGELNIVVDSVLAIGAAMRMSWTGTPCKDGETLSAILRRDMDGKAASHITYVSDIKAAQVVFDEKDTRLFEPGTYTISLTKYKSVPLQQSDAGASGEINVSLVTQRQVIVQ